MTDTIQETLTAQFGFTTFQPGQREVIEYLMAGKSAAAVFPTGGGKSLCYQLPALLLPGLTLVVSPLIALMKDQLDALTSRGIAAARIDSTLDGAAYRETMDRLRARELRLLYVAPERFNNERFRAAMQQSRISLFAVDEAHCISEWGHNFRPDYLKLAEFAKNSGAERCLALTATATPAVLDDICRVFGIESEAAIRTGFYRPNLHLRFTPVDVSRRNALLIDRLSSRPPGPGIVYVTLQRTAEDVAEILSHAGLAARAYHAGMEDDQRSAVQDWFMQSSDGIVVATIAFGMGIDKRDIRYVDHYNLPKSLENYSQEVGRAGRDGAPAQCEVFAAAEDLNVLENFIFGDTPSLEACESLLAKLFGGEDEFDVGHYELSAAHDIRILVVRTLLTYLELDGYLRGGTPFYASYQFQPLASSAEILGRFDGERREFLTALFRLAQPAKTWFSIDVDAAAKRLRSDRHRIIRALDYLEEQQLLKLKVAGVRHPYRCLKRPASTAALAAELHGRMTQREVRDVARLDEVIALVEHNGCQTQHLARHFGETTAESCGHCSWCERHAPAVMPTRDASEMDADVWNQAFLLRREQAALRDPRSLARFLCGLSSPRLVRAKLMRDPLYGAFESVPFADVLRHAEAAERESVGAASF